MKNREIKFRAWIKKHNIMVYSNHSDICRTGENEFEVSPFVVEISVNDPLLVLEQIVWMQFTGLKDKNGKEIYEGDILQIETANHQVINVVCEFGIARRKMDTGWEVDIPSFYLKRGDGLKSFPIVKNWQGKHDLEIIEVIGNIYENPDLIKI